MYWKSFLRATGFRQSFRSTGPSSLLNLAVAAGLGVASGHYIFKQPLEEYWSNAEHRKEHDQRQQQQQQASSSSMVDVSRTLQTAKEPLSDATTKR